MLLSLFWTLGKEGRREITQTLWINWSNSILWTCTYFQSNLNDHVMLEEIEKLTFTFEFSERIAAQKIISRWNKDLFHLTSHFSVNSRIPLTIFPKNSFLSTMLWHCCCSILKLFEFLLFKGYFCAFATFRREIRTYLKSFRKLFPFGSLFLEIEQLLLFSTEVKIT